MPGIGLRGRRGGAACRIEERVRCLVRNARFLAFVGLVATLGRSDSAYSVEPLNIRDRRENSAAHMVRGLEQQPGDRARVGRISTLEDRGNDRAAIEGFPGR